MVAIVGMRASCQPMPVLRMETPAASSACASATTSGQSEPAFTRSSIERRKIMMKSGAVAARIPSTMRSARRVRLSKLPPQASVRVFTCLARNWLSR